MEKRLCFEPSLIRLKWFFPGYFTFKFLQKV